MLPRCVSDRKTHAGSGRNNALAPSSFGQTGRASLQLPCRSRPGHYTALDALGRDQTSGIARVLCMRTFWKLELVRDLITNGAHYHLDRLVLANIEWRSIVSLQFHDRPKLICGRPYLNFAATRPSPCLPLNAARLKSLLVRVTTVLDLSSSSSRTV